MYRILRNNKEQGPFSLEELVQLSLRPFDLVWVEGKSACWRYPTEIEELKLYVNGPVVDIVSVQPLQQSEIPKKAPSEMLVTANEVTSEEPELTADILEQKANAIYQRIQAYNAKSEQEAKDVQTKYARSLEDLKQDYADWLHGKKQKRRDIHSNNKGWVAFGAVSAAFIIFVLAGKDKEIVWPTLIQNNKIGSANTKTSEDENQAKSTLSIPIRELPEQSPEKQLTTIQYFIDSVRTALRKKESAVKPGAELAKGSKKKVADSQIYKPPVEIMLPTPIEEKVITPFIKAADLDAHYIPSENSARIKEIKVTVHNTGTVALKQVLVDVFYYKKGERLVDKETISFNDIKPGNAFTVSKPGNKKAVFARFELGELTADN